MAFSFRKHIILSRLYDLRDELAIAATEQNEAEEEKKKSKKAKKPESEKARKIKRGIIIFLYVASIVLCIATFTYVTIYFCIENGVFGDDWRENRFLFAFYDWLMEDKPVSDGLYTLKKEYYNGFAFYAVLSIYAGTIGTFALIYMLMAYIRGKTKDEEIPLFDNNGMRLDVKMTLENTYGDILNYRDWDKLDMIIYLLETYRADTIKEALQLIDREQQSN
ncbi:MAG: hypothetical protein K2O89_01595 [Clostridia bacterium]|nr:hypothetical protein [Clostridia bacterium]